jgi:bifunctional aspartokinase / homoserine dehydrogenase 1
MKVLKFGGTSVGTTEAILALLRIVKNAREQDNELVVVCSAMHGVTSGLIALLEEAATGNDYLPGFKSIEERHYQAVRKLLEIKRQNQALLGLKLLFNELEELLAGVKALGEVSDRIRDRVLSFGELLSCSMIAHFVDQHCGKAVLADTRRLIETDSRYGKANVNEEVTNERIQIFVSSQSVNIHVFTGFIASDKNGETTTLGRGGSDYTAAIVGCCHSCIGNTDLDRCGWHHDCRSTPGKKSFLH